MTEKQLFFAPKNNGRQIGNVGGVAVQPTTISPPIAKPIQSSVNNTAVALKPSPKPMVVANPKKVAVKETTEDSALVYFLEGAVTIAKIIFLILFLMVCLATGTLIWLLWP